MFSGGTPPRSIALSTPVNEPLALSIVTLMSTVDVDGMPARTMPLIPSMTDALTLNTLSGLFCPVNVTAVARAGDRRPRKVGPLGGARLELGELVGEAERRVLAMRAAVSRDRAREGAAVGHLAGAHGRHRCRPSGCSRRRGRRGSRPSSAGATSRCSDRRGRRRRRRRRGPGSSRSPSSARCGRTRRTARAHPATAQSAAIARLGTTASAASTHTTTHRGMARTLGTGRVSDRHPGRVIAGERRRANSRGSVDLAVRRSSS